MNNEEEKPILIPKSAFKNIFDMFIYANTMGLAVIVMTEGEEFLNLTQSIIESDQLKSEYNIKKDPIK
jgi:hypothetical protein